MKVRLTRKLADEIDGIDLSDHHAGDVMSLADPEARTLMAEGWAIEERREPRQPDVVNSVVLAFRRSTDPGHWAEREEEDRNGDYSRAS